MDRFVGQARFLSRLCDSRELREGLRLAAFFVSASSDRLPLTFPQRATFLRRSGRRAKRWCAAARVAKKRREGLAGRGWPRLSVPTYFHRWFSGFVTCTSWSAYNSDSFISRSAIRARTDQSINRFNLYWSSTPYHLPRTLHES